MWVEALEWWYGNVRNGCDFFCNMSEFFTQTSPLSSYYEKTFSCLYYVLLKMKKCTEILVILKIKRHYGIFASIEEKIHLYSVSCSIEYLSKPAWNSKTIMKGAELRRSSLTVRKYSGSHRKLRPAGAEYELNDGWLRNVAAHSGFPYLFFPNFISIYVTKKLRLIFQVLILWLFFTESVNLRFCFSAI